MTGAKAWPRCGKRTMRYGYKCVRRKGHDGLHSTSTGRQFRTPVEIRRALSAK